MVIVTGSVLFVSSDQVSALLFGERSLSGLLMLFIASIPFVVGLEIAVAGLRGCEHTRYRVYTQDILYKGLRICLIGALLVSGVGVLAAGYAYLTAAAVACIVACLLLNRVLPLIGSFELHTRAMLSFSAPLMISAVVGTVLARTDTLMLGYYLSPTEAGVYNAAFPLSRALPVIVSSFEFIYLPLASRLDADGSRSELDHLYKLTAKWAFILAFPVFLCLVAFPSDLLTMIFDREYARGGPALAILSVGLLIGAAYGRCQDTLSAFGLTKYILGVNAAAAILNIALNLMLIPSFGILGAAVASACSLIGLNGFALIILRHESEITPISRWTLRTFIVLPIVLIPLAYLFSQWIDLTFITLVPFLIGSGLATVILLGISGGFQPADELPIELAEQRLGIHIPFIRRCIPGANRSSSDYLSQESN